MTIPVERQPKDCMTFTRFLYYRVVDRVTRPEPMEEVAAM
jgi:hypothetical protein